MLRYISILLMCLPLSSFSQVKNDTMIHLSDSTANKIRATLIRYDYVNGQYAIDEAIIQSYNTNKKTTESIISSFQNEIKNDSIIVAQKNNIISECNRHQKSIKHKLALEKTKNIIFEVGIIGIAGIIIYDKLR